MKKQNFLALILVFCLLIPSAVSAAEPDSAKIQAVGELEAMPACWSPLEELTAEEELLLALTSDRLYVLSADGQELIPSMAAALPVDVTEQYVGSYGIGAETRRGYAFLITLDPGAVWEDGSPIDADDFLFTLNLLIDRGEMEPVLANYNNYLSRIEKPTDSIISLMDAGYGSVEDAAAAGHTAFYVDVGHFWGLDAGWVPASDVSRLKDAAIPSGVTEMYVSGAYLFNRYLRTGKSQSVFQTEFVGVAENPEYVSREEIGLIRKNSYEFILITEKPTTAEALALQLAELIPVRPELYDEAYATSPDRYSSCGPYRIVAMENGRILLERNEAWLGKTETVSVDSIRLGTDIGA